MRLLAVTDATLTRLAKRHRRNWRTTPVNDNGPRPLGICEGDYWQRMSDAMFDASVHFVR